MIEKTQILFSFDCVTIKMLLVISVVIIVMML